MDPGVIRNDEGTKKEGVDLDSKNTEEHRSLENKMRRLPARSIIRTNSIRKLLRISCVQNVPAQSTSVPCSAITSHSHLILIVRFHLALADNDRLIPDYLQRLQAGRRDNLERSPIVEAFSLFRLFSFY